MATADVPKLDAMTTEAKRALLRALLLDLAPGDGGLGSIDVGDRQVYVYAPPANAREDAQKFLEQCSPEYLEELRRRANDTDPKNLMSLDEVLNLRDEEEAIASVQPQSLPGSMAESPSARAG